MSSFSHFDLAYTSVAKICQLRFKLTSHIGELNFILLTSAPSIIRESVIIDKIGNIVVSDLLGSNVVMIFVVVAHLAVVRRTEHVANSGDVFTSVQVPEPITQLQIDLRQVRTIALDRWVGGVELQLDDAALRAHMSLLEGVRRRRPDLTVTLLDVLRLRALGIDCEHTVPVFALADVLGFFLALFAVFILLLQRGRTHVSGAAVILVGLRLLTLRARLEVSKDSVLVVVLHTELAKLGLDLVLAEVDCGAIFDDRRACLAFGHGRKQFLELLLVHTGDGALALAFGHTLVLLVHVGGVLLHEQLLTHLTESEDLCIEVVLQEFALL